MREMRERRNREMREDKDDIARFLYLSALLLG